MNNTTPTRRDVLKTAASATVVGGIATTTSAAASGQTAQVLEAGIRYEVADNQELVQHEQDSRPPYTVDEDNERFLVSPHAGVSGDLTDRIAEAGALVAEQPVGPGETRGLSESEPVSELPLGLTTRMRPRKTLSLAGDHTLPTVNLVRNGKQAKLIIRGGPTRRIESQTDHTVRLDTETVSAQTSRVIDELVDNSDIPDYRKAKKREYGTKQVEVTPVVEVAHRGELEIVPRKIA